ncbi:ArsR family transcriptional regulator [uncultured Paraglaciecola sp.]|uniref:VpaChn25_0724 family phage protein n=1 Tax=uncultured Paraglaciecola sp. TaxID=1765024 RepID=UPI002631A79E|nr:ArsR family transcriptional regulator [uncultured Paraglaciecola sp.]
MAIESIMNEHQRLSILHCLAAMDSYSTNDSIVQSVCTQYGNSMTIDKIRTHLYWLKEQGLVTLEETGPYMVAALTSRGIDAEAGLAKVPGIKRPAPRV